MDTQILRIALENAIKYNGKCSLNSVTSKVFSSINVQDKGKLIEEIKKVVDYVNNLDVNKQKEMYGGPLTIIKKIKIRVVPELYVKKNVVMRFAPNPNGPLSFGHCRQALWNWFFVQKYKGKFILRFDDTDPKVKVPLKEAYDWIKEDLNWLGIKPKIIVTQSKRLEVYYKFGKRLLFQGNAYVCTCEPEIWRGLVSKKKSCKCRDLNSDEQIIRWENMFEKYKEGQAVYRVKTDITHPNPAVRDWAGFRIVNKSKHPLNKKARVWPLLNFASAIDDHDFGITHILRGVDLRVSDERQIYLYKYFGWKYPITRYSGKLLIKGVKSTSETQKLLDMGKLFGWDDPRLGTIRSFRRKGFKAEAIIQFIKDQGLRESDVNVSIEALNALNKGLIDKIANRYFFVEKPQKVIIKSAPKMKIKVVFQPKDPKSSARIFNTDNIFYVPKIKKFKVYRLLHLFNFRGEKFISKDYDASLKPELIQWVPAKNNVKVDIMNLDGKVVSGVGESSLKKLKIGSNVQFLRYGYCKLDKKLRNKLVFWYTHS